MTRRRTRRPITQRVLVRRPSRPIVPRPFFRLPPLSSRHGVAATGRGVDRDLCWWCWPGRRSSRSPGGGRGGALTSTAPVGSPRSTSCWPSMCLCAMLIRLPWRRRQIGFLMTHGGILVLLAGCAATHWAGVEAQLSVYEGHANHVAEIDRPQTDAESEKGGAAGTGLPSLSASIPSSARSRQRNAVVLFEPGRFSRTQRSAETVERREEYCEKTY